MPGLVRPVSLRPLAVPLLVLALVAAGCAAPSSPGGQALSASDPDAASDGSSTTATGSATGTNGTSSAPGYSWQQQGCPTHWHATFRIYTPGPDGEPRMLDMRGPVDANGHPYYDLGRGRMTVAVHMHQSGAEQGDAVLSTAQIHYEGGVCVNVQATLKTIDVGLTGKALAIAGQHSQTNSTGIWLGSADHPLRTWIQGANGTWTERAAASILEYQLKDGESLLVSLGNYTDAQVAAMQASVPVPLGRPAPARFQESWETDGTGWAYDSADAKRDCGAAVQGSCSLLLNATCCSRRIGAERTFEPALPTPATVVFAFQGGATKGDTDAEVHLDTGAAKPLVYSFTRGSGNPNTGLSLDNGQSSGNACGSWSTAGAWVTVTVRLANGTAHASARDGTGKLLGSCDYPYEGDGLHAIRFESVAWSGPKVPWRFDGLIVS